MHKLASLIFCGALCAAPALPVLAQAQAQAQAPAQAQPQKQWQAIEPAAVAPLTPAEAALWPEAMAAPAGPPTRSLGVLLRLFQPRHDPAAEFALPVADAPGLRNRVAGAVNQAAPGAFTRETDGRFTTLAAADGVADALADTITAALLQAGHSLRQAAGERWAAQTKGLLRALHDPRALEEARLAAASGSALAEVEAVRVVEPDAQPAQLWLAVRAAGTRPRALIARVNLDEVLTQVARRAP